VKPDPNLNSVSIVWANVALMNLAFDYILHSFISLTTPVVPLFTQSHNANHVIAVIRGRFCAAVLAQRRVEYQGGAVVDSHFETS
jgi:hypothetical protein